MAGTQEVTLSFHTIKNLCYNVLDGLLYDKTNKSRRRRSDTFIRHQQQQQKPSCSLVRRNSLPSTCTITELDNLVCAIDRLFRLVPELNNQREEIRDIRVERVIERLSRGRMEDQRAEQDKLFQLIQKATSRSLDTQREHMKPVSLPMYYKRYQYNNSLK